MPSQPVSVFITSFSTRDSSIERNTTLQKKSQKDKISGTRFTKQIIAEIRRPSLTDLVDKLADVLGANFLQRTRDYIKYKNRTLIYHYRLSVIFRGFH